MYVGYQGIKSSKCPRCNLQFNDREIDCPHCLGLSDSEAEKHKPNFKKESFNANKSLGKVFKLLFLFVFFLLVLLALV
jgi:hypothetical protein